ncbi:type II and III secretion system protein family protein [Sphingomonas sp.]|uniref:type II and III secretion system protein family protein n=1 Tax=Sphingomonas sp. TaxID=28214 RepID=UPI003B3B129D
MTPTRTLLRAGMPIFIAAMATSTLIAPDPVRAQAAEPATGNRAEIPTRVITLSVGQGQLVRLARPMTEMFVADDRIADVQVKGTSALYLFAKTPGETTVYATDRSGAVVWSSNVRVGNNIAGVGAMLKAVMPESDIVATPVSGMVLLTGTVANPKDVEEAQRLTEAFAAGAQVVNRLRTPTPLQVNLQVRVAEVNRDLVKSIGVNLLSRDTSGGFLFGIGQGSPGTITTVDGATRYAFNNKAGATTLGLAGHLLGMDLMGTLDLAERDGLVTTLAEPNLTALSGETASFLAGGEIPVPISQGFGAVSVEYKQYGVSLAFTPTVMSGGRIALKVRPEVSQLDAANGVRLNEFTVPAVTTRRAETTIELGSGQSFMIGGLLNNNTENATDRAPGLGNLPIIGALFRSNSFRRRQTELVIIVTPYLVRPATASALALPTDGYRAPSDADRVLNGTTYRGEPAVPPATGGK